MTALFIAGAITYHPTDFSALTWEKLVVLFSAPEIANPNHEILATALLLSVTLALSTAAVVSNLATSLQNCTDEQNETIKWFLLWMHGMLTLVMLVYSALLFRTNIRLQQFSDGSFIVYFGVFYMMISVLIFLIPAVKYKLLTTRTLVLAFAGFNLPPWVSSFLSTIKLENYPLLMKIWGGV